MWRASTPTTSPDRRNGSPDWYLHRVATTGTPSGATTLVRGYPNRVTNFQEQFQIAYVNSVAAAAGCIVGELRIDDGIDLTLRHKASCHTSINDRVARLEVQLKATGSGLAHAKSGFVSAVMSKDRFEEFSIGAGGQTLPKIVVILAMPVQQDDWIESSDAELRLRHCAYWVNLEGQTTAAKRPTVKAPTSNRFDDVALIGMMARIGQGQKP